MDAWLSCSFPLYSTHSPSVRKMCSDSLGFFVCLYQDEAHPIQGLCRIHVSDWICASKFADAN